VTTTAEVKRCPTCKLTLPVAQFSRNKRRSDGLQTRCKACSQRKRKPNTEANRLRNNAYRREQTRIRRDLVSAAKSVPCTDCKVTYPPYVMDLDHVRGEKVADLCDMVRRCFAVEAIVAEIAKCEPVCSNCHRERTHQRTP